jgi:hypothetical protein
VTYLDLDLPSSVDYNFATQVALLWYDLPAILNYLALKDIQGPRRNTLVSLYRRGVSLRGERFRAAGRSGHGYLVRLDSTPIFV